MKLRQISAGILAAAITLNTMLFQNSKVSLMEISAATDNYEDYLSYNIIDEDGDGKDDCVAISYCEDTVKTMIIPNKIEGLPVKIIDDNAFYECKSLTSVSMPDSIKRIGDYSFYRCINLSKINISKNTEYIGSYAFYGCQNLTSMSVPQYVSEINEAAFSYCIYLKSITLGNKISSIGDNAFYSCYSLTSVKIPESVNEIGDSAFYCCNKLSNITIYSYECDIYDNPSTICSSYNEDEDTFLFNGTIYGYNGSTAQAYAENCEYKFSSLGEYIPPATEEITEPTEPPEENYDVSYELIDENEDNNYDYVQIIDSDKSLTSIEIPEKIDGLPVVSIDESAFENSAVLESVLIPATVTSIGANAFLNCENLKNINIPGSVKNIGENAFSGTKWLSDKQAENPLVIVNNILINGALCSGSIKIPENVEIIGVGAFMNCENLEDVTMPDSVTDIRGYAFYNCISLKNVAIPKSVIKIDDYAFDSSDNIESITILNPECEIFDSSNTLCADLICGYKDSTAQTYAEIYNFDFKTLDDEKETLKGDISGNGKIDLYDAIEIAKYMVGIRKFNDEEIKIADINNDGKVDLYDAIQVAKYILGK